MLYVVTDFAEENLGQILPNRPLTIPETEYMLRSVLEVLGYLHGPGTRTGESSPETSWRWPMIFGWRETPSARPEKKI